MGNAASMPRVPRVPRSQALLGGDLPRLSWRTWTGTRALGTGDRRDGGGLLGRLDFMESTKICAMDHPFGGELDESLESLETWQELLDVPSGNLT